MNEELKKSIDSLIDDLFAEDSVEKSMVKDLKAEEETADEAMKKVPKAESDEKRGAGRPKQISDVPMVDTDGKRQAEYDDEIAEKNEDGKTKEQDQVKAPAELVKKSETAVSNWENSPEYKEYQELKKAKEAAVQAEELKKARQEQTDLIKSAVAEATSSIREENELLRKSLSEQSELLKSIANKPQRAKAVTSLAAVERFEKSDSKTFSKAEILDVAEELVKSGKFRDEFTETHVIELEQTGRIYDAEPRGILERALKRS